MERKGKRKKERKGKERNKKEGLKQEKGRGGSLRTKGRGKRRGMKLRQRK